MKAWMLILKVFGYVWVTLAGLLIAAGIFGVWLKEGFSGVRDLLSPFNILNFILTVITLAPGVGALMWAEKLRKKTIYEHE